ncbi:MAG: hypothetical protein D6744_02860 [Planctomycetota bacterium]|nr:MAG: hypothetical protein D6744_02860 [Planctomycetota bacterium]
MATTRGCNGQLVVLTVPVAELIEWSFEDTSEQIDVSAMGDCTKKFSAGGEQTVINLQHWWQNGVTFMWNVLPVGTVIGAAQMAIYPAGDARAKPSSPLAMQRWSVNHSRAAASMAPCASRCN